MKEYKETLKQYPKNVAKKFVKLWCFVFLWGVGMMIVSAAVLSIIVFYLQYIHTK